MRQHRPLKFILFIGLALGPGFPAYGDDGDLSSCSDASNPPDAGDCTSTVKECSDAGSTIEGTVALGLGSANSGPDAMKTGATTSAGVWQSAATSYATAQDTCSDSLKQCGTKCGKTDTSATSKCKSQIKSITKCYAAHQADATQRAAGFNSSQQAATASPASTGSNTNDAAGGGKSSGSSGSGSGSGGGSMMQQMLPLLAMGGMAAMMMSKKSDSSSTPPPWPSNAALLQSGQLDCSKPDGFVYHDCETIVSANCTQEIVSGAYLTDSTCQAYSARYCGGDGSAMPIPTPATSGPALGTPGEGASSTYCLRARQVNFCQVAGRAQCPSCLQLQQMQSTICIANPASCLGGSSAAATAAVGNSACPIQDPLTTTVTTASTAATPATTVAVVVPQSVNANRSGASMTVASVKSAASSPTKTSDIAGLDGRPVMVANTATTYAGGSNQTSTIQTASVNSRAVSMASGGGGSAGASASAPGIGAAVKVASAQSPGTTASANVGAGPASDVQGEYGASLFTTGSQIYRARCQSGRLNNCP